MDSFAPEAGELGAVSLAEIRPGILEQQKQYWEKGLVSFPDTEASSEEEQSEIYKTWYQAFREKYREVFQPPVFDVQSVVQLKEICENKRYVSSNDLIDKGKAGIVVDTEENLRVCPWLEWDEYSIGIPYATSYFDSIFSPFEPLVTESIHGGHSTKPIYSTLHADFLWGWKRGLSDEQRELDNHDLTHFYEELIREFAEVKRIPVGRISRLYALREAYESQVKRAVEQLLIPLGHIRNILSVCAVETENRYLHHFETDYIRGEPLTQFEIEDPMMVRLHGELNELWQWSICKGVPLQLLLNKSFHRLSEPMKRIAPPLLGLTARQGIVYYLRQRDSILGEIYLIDEKRRLIEWFMQYALKGEEVDDWERITEHVEADRLLENKRYNAGSGEFWEYVDSLRQENRTHPEIYEHVTLEADKRGLRTYKNFQSYEQSYQRRSRREAGKN